MRVNYWVVLTIVVALATLAAGSVVAATKVPLQYGARAPRPVDRQKLRGRVEKISMPEQSWEESYRDGDSLYRAGRYDEAYKVWATTLALAEHQNSATLYSGPRQIEVLKKLATLYKTQQKPAAAAKVYELAITAAVKQHGPRTVQVAQLMLDLGRMYTFYDELRNYAKADELLTESFRIHESLYGRYTIPTGDVAIALAQLMQYRGRHEEAVWYWKLAIDIGDRLEPNTISCCRIGPRQGLSQSYEKLGHYEQALKVHQELLAMCRKGATGMMSTVLTNYAECLSKLGHTTEANEMLAAAKMH